MREIKFRAFQDGHMITSPIGSNYGLHRFFGLLYEDTLVMQFTGLHDKNGKEIYEGDILHRDNFSDWVVTYKAPSFVIYNICDPSRTFPIWGVDTDEREVIGNIYENPELLEAK